MDVLALWGLNTTTACVTVFVLALGLLWLYVILASPSKTARREYERLEQLLHDETARKAAGKASAGKREGKKSKGKGKTSIEGSPRSSLSPRKKKSLNPDTISSPPPPTTEVRARNDKECEGTVVEKPSPPASVSVAKKQAVAKKPSKNEGEDGGEDGFTLVATKSSSGKGKGEVPIVMPLSMETKKEPTTKAGQRKKHDDSTVSKATTTKKSSSGVKPTYAEEEIPVVKGIISEDDKGVPAVTKATVTKHSSSTISEITAIKEDPSKEDPSKEDASVVTKATTIDVREQTKEKNKKEKVLSSSGSDEGVKDKEDGKWHTQLSRQQLRALKQKEKDKLLANEKQQQQQQQKTFTAEGGRGGRDGNSGGTQGAGMERGERREGGGTGERREVGGVGGGPGGRGGRREGGRVRRERVGEPKRWNLPEKAVTEVPAVSLPEATPTQTTPTLVTPSVENLSDVPVAHSNITDLEKAMQEAASTAPISSDDLTMTSPQIPTHVDTTTTINNVPLQPNMDIEPQSHDLTSEHDDVVFPSATVTDVSVSKETPEGVRGHSGDEEATAVSSSGAESPDVEEWVVLEPPPT